MSENTQVILPPPSREEDAVVERFITASRELAPTVQVSLAKRIMHPGSNRVVCLAAHTTVPLNEDELASVSDLALRLSDGTNVRLSVSFFQDDDTVFGATVPMTRTIYDPNRYSMQGGGGESKLGLVLCAMATIVLASYYGCKNYNFNPLSPATVPAPTSAALLQTNPHAAKAPAPLKSVNKAPASPAEHLTKTGSSPDDVLTEAPPKVHGRHARSVRHITTTEEPGSPGISKHSSRSKPDLMLVPPPPPFAVPLGGSGMPFAPSYDLRNLDGSNQFGVSSKADSAARPAKVDLSGRSATSPKGDASQHPSGLKLGGSVSPPAVNNAAHRIELDPDVLLPGAAPARSNIESMAAPANRLQRPAPANISSFAPASAPVEQYRGSALETTAPTPGDSVQLERIVPPEQ